MDVNVHEKVVVKYPFINYHEILRLRGGAGKKGGYVPVSKLTEEQKVVRKADESRRKDAQRAKERGITVQEYKDNKGKQKAQFVPENVQPALRKRAEKTNATVLKRRVAAEKKKTDQETRATERRAVREELEKQKKADKGNWNRSMWGLRSKAPERRLQLGQSIRQNRNKLRTQLRKHLKKAGTTKAEWDPMSDKIRSALLPPLEIKNVYAFKEKLNRWVIEGVGHRDPEMFIGLCKPLVRRVIDGSKGPSKKVRLVLNVHLKNFDKADGSEKKEDHGFRSGTLTDISKDDFRENWEEMITTILTRVSNHQLKGSGWTLDGIINLEIFIDNYNPLSGKKWIKLPDWISRKGAIINPKNMTGSDCFQLAVAISLILEKNPNIIHPERLPKIVKLKAKELNMGGIKLPMEVDNISEFENLNPSINVLVLGISDDGTEIVRLRSKRQTKKDEKITVPLFLWGDENGTHHYGCVKNFSALVASQKSTRKAGKEVCLNCCNMFGTEELKKEHEEKSGCFEHDTQATEFIDRAIMFKNYGNTQKMPFVIYSDLEAFNIKLPVDKEKNTVKISEQTPSGIGYVIIGPKEFKTKYRKFDTVEEYAESLDKDVREIRRDWFREGKPLIMSDEDTKNYDRTSKCYQCGFVLVKGENKNRDHDHFTGEFRGAACTGCNLLMRKPNFIPVYFHNLEGYDSHLIIREISKLGGRGMKCIPHTKENYISFSVSLKVPHYEIPNTKRKEKYKPPEFDTFDIRFVDSFKLMSSGLGSLVNTLQDDDFKITKKLFGKISEKQFKLLRRKGVYPYDWVSNKENLEMRELPPIEVFYNTLNEGECTPEDYEHAKEVWKAFGMKTMQDYHDLYLKSDITQLADVIEKFRNFCHGVYGLDPSWYFTVPGLSNDAQLKSSGVILRTIPEPDMHLFIERCTRGGISVIVKRYSEANHKYMKKYDPSKPSSFIIDLDRNNLYGEAMSDMLPKDGFRWMVEDELENWNKFPKSVGCFLEVDLDYPDHLHDLHNDYPMACERVVVEGDKEDNAKLVPNLNNKRNYVIHYKELELCLKHGLILRKIHKGLKFNQSPWLKDYISMNTELRTKATTKFEKDFFKLMNNSVFGKTMENVRNRRNVDLITDNNDTMGKLLNKRISKPEYLSSTVFSDNLVAVESSRTKVLLNKPMYAGAAILSISKVKMYEFFYEYVKPKWGENVNLLYTDTDSLCLEIRTEDFYKDIMDDVGKYFDTSEISPELGFVKDLNFPVGKNKKKLTMMKDEAGGRNIVRSVGLRPKMYANEMEGDEEDIKRCKGVKKYVVKNIEFEEYRKCLFERSSVYKSQNTLRNHEHRMYVEKMTKKALCGEDNKRVILEDRINTLAWGHWRLRDV